MIAPRTLSPPRPLARPAFLVVARRHLNPDAFPQELADAASRAPDEVACIECHLLSDAIAAGRVLHASRAFGYHLAVDIATPIGETIAHVSPNGRVWCGATGDWTPDTPELEAGE